MNPDLKSKLKGYGLLPRDMDPEGEAELQMLIERGLVVEKLETHNPPGMPDEEIRAYETIHSALGLLRDLQKQGELDTPAYQDAERLIEESLPIIPRPGSVRIGFPQMSTRTGIAGFDRDPYFMRIVRI